LASNLNFGPGQTIPNMVLVPVGAGGQVSIYNSGGSSDVIVDVLGWFPTGDAFTGLTPARLLDTRPGQSTVDGSFNGVGAIGPAGVLGLSTLGRGGVPGAGVGAVALNVTVTNPTSAGFLTVWPTGSQQPLASNLNFGPGQTIPNMVLVPVGAGGQVAIYNSGGSSDVIVDVLGWFPTGDAFTGLTPARLMDTRVPPPPPPPPILTFGPGTHLVNSTIPAGRYVANTDDGCYWERLSGLGGTLDEIIANDFRGYAGRSIVDVSASDLAFSFDADCGNFSTYVASGSPINSIVPGSHVVGSDIQPGTYSTNAQDGCYWERTTSFSGELSAIIANDFISQTGPALVTISPSDVGFTSDADCGTWALV
jgi:hypothetical protein